MPHALLDRFERLIRRDPARRGLIGSESVHGPLGVGELQGAAVELVRHARAVGIVTGFFVPRADPPAAETDGPPGAVFLANALQSIGVTTWLLTDGPCASALRAVAAAAGFPQEQVLVLDGKPDCRTDCQSVLPLTDGLETRPTETWTHLIAIERPGPSHTLDSLVAQPRTGAPPIERFAAEVPAEHRDRCHNMRGETIDQFTAPLHRLFEKLPRLRPGVRTIGLGDGGNEIGMGRVPWEDLVGRLGGSQAPWLPCRIATDWNIIAGTSNWGAYALAASVLVLGGVTEALRPWDRNREQTILEAMVAHGPAVDGVTRRREPTVDGLPFLTYIQPWEGMRRLLGFDG